MAKILAKILGRLAAVSQLPSNMPRSEMISTAGHTVFVCVYCFLICLHFLLLLDHAIFSPLPFCLHIFPGMFLQLAMAYCQKSPDTLENEKGWGKNSMLVRPPLGCSHCGLQQLSLLVQRALEGGVRGREPGALAFSSDSGCPRSFTICARAPTHPRKTESSLSCLYST